MINMKGGAAEGRRGGRSWEQKGTRRWDTEEGRRGGSRWGVKGIKIWVAKEVSAPLTSLEENEPPRKGSKSTSPSTKLAANLCIQHACSNKLRINPCSV